MAGRGCRPPNDGALVGRRAPSAIAPVEYSQQALLGQTLPPPLRPIARNRGVIVQVPFGLKPLDQVVRFSAPRHSFACPDQIGSRSSARARLDAGTTHYVGKRHLGPDAQGEGVAVLGFLGVPEHDLPKESSAAVNLHAVALHYRPNDRHHRTQHIRNGLGGRSTSPNPSA